MKKNYLRDAVIDSYKDYKSKGLRKRAEPFLLNSPPNKPNNLLVVGVALGGKEEIKALNKYFPKYQIYGIDIVKETLNIKTRALLYHSDVARLVFPNKFFSGIMCSAVMHEVFSYSKRGKSRVKKAISEISRCLSKEGVCAIREFYVPDEQNARIICLTEEAKEFANKFIARFRKDLEPELSRRYNIEGSIISAKLSLLYDLLLHFRVTKAHYKSFESLCNSKEIEERYAALSTDDYIDLLVKNGLTIESINYIDFPHYRLLVSPHFKILNEKGQEIPPKFGFMDIVSRKK
jgi:ubiquinone/menaquinone biosynthesis C-methylase UbiE